MLMLVAVGLWLALGVYSVWFFFRAETLQPLTLNQLALTWGIHKRETGCKASRIRNLITRNNEVVGFECDCGSRFLQKRLLTQEAPMYIEKGVKPSGASKGLISPKRTRNQLRKLGIRYTGTKEI